MSNRSGGGGGNNNGKGSGGISSIPVASRKMVQSLKEIVNCPEPEIYAMLKDCNMDPNEAVNRLLSQDPFHEVKSKREKKKESKDVTEPRARSTNYPSNRSGRSGADRNAGRTGSTQFSSNESGNFYSKPGYRKDNGAQAYTGASSSASGVTGNNINQRPASHSDDVTTVPKISPVDIVDSVSSLAHPGFQSAWSGIPAQVSMADIVKMGRPHGKFSDILAPPSHCDVHESSKISDLNSAPEAPTREGVHPQDEWPPIEQPPIVSLSSVLDPHAERGSLNQKINVPVEEDDSDGTPKGNHVRSSSTASRHRQEENTEGASLFDDSDWYQNKRSYQPHRHAADHIEAENGVTSVVANLQHLSLEKDDQCKTSEEDKPLVVIPDHLQVYAPECSQLNFGSFRSGAGTSVSQPYLSKPLDENLEGTPSGPDAISVGHADRDTKYYGDENLRIASADNLIHGSGAEDYGISSVPQLEVSKQDPSEPTQGNRYAFSSSAPVCNYENNQRVNDAFSQQQANSQLQDLASFSNVMQAYTGSLPNTLLGSSVQAVREPDLAYSPFPVTQSMPPKYSAAASSSGPSISMAEDLRAGGISMLQPNQQTLPGANANVATGPSLPQQLTVHPYSQPTLPVGNVANMVGYPFLPQNYTYMPSGFQHAFAGNSTYHQSLAALLPQYKNSLPVSSLPQSAAVASGYGYGSSTNFPGQNFSLNTPSAPVGTTIGFNDVLTSQYKEGNHIMSLQQNENPAMWAQGASSRTMSTVAANSYYNFPGQNQQPGGFRHNQQPSQNFGALGYPNFYHSQSGISLEQQQNPRDPTLGGSQGQSVKQSQQIWQNSY